MIKITQRLKNRIERYRKEHRHSLDNIKGFVVRVPSLVELSERYPNRKIV